MTRSHLKQENRKLTQHNKQKAITGFIAQYQLRLEHNYKLYLTAKNDANSKLYSFYENEAYRKMRWNTYINMSRSEDAMINRFKKKYGTPADVVVAFGDWEQKHQMKFKQPTKGKGFRKLFRKHGYEVFLVDEFRTSCMCYHCADDSAKCEKFLYVDNKSPRSKNERPQILCHGLLKCKTCSRIWNRDTNASLNIGRAGKQMLETSERPKYLRRSLSRKTTDQSGNPDINPPKRRRITSVHVEACTTRERLLEGSELGMPFFSFFLCNSLSQLEIQNKA